MAFEIVIGLEVHAELATRSKIFCSCSSERGAEQNRSVCPACAGMPGMLPVINRKVIDLAMTAGMLLNCQINRVISFDKKNYYYPDLPNAYQITQWFSPICRDGFINIDTQDEPRKIGIKQIHMEEDAGKLIHDSVTGTSLVDFNRTSVPLIEIVSQPDLRSAGEVTAYLHRLRALLRYGGISQARWEEGSIRCDVNISVRREGADEKSVRTEMKNMNSLSAIERAIEYESTRHIEAIEYGTERLIQETRGWDDAQGCSFSMRHKETAADYRYFPDPNLMPIRIDENWIKRIQSALPETPELRAGRYIQAYALSKPDCELLVSSPAIADLFEAVAEKTGLPRETAAWIISDLFRIARRLKTNLDDISISSEKFADLIIMVANNEINRAAGRKALDMLFEHGTDPRDFARDNNLAINKDTGDMEQVVRQILRDHADIVSDYVGGRVKARQALVGAVMRALKGKGDPAIVNHILDDAIAKLPSE
ncbi:MAG: Asp-tRNA(Asn)/Glu-tRNA(Gln) amidotransferase subunit GatB [Clostridia bacterium]|nr:Asp-tRNA(Asn)/Glu-tRNA(Gln) amidotransferase subunit GatB [Clostridia bacterium]